MSAVDLDQARFNMVEQQIRPWDVLDSKVLNTLQQVARDEYVPEAYKNLAYADTAIPLSDNASMMHPVLEGRMLQALDIQRMDEVLEIGTGSGYITACLAHLGSHVDTVEIDKALSEQAAAKFVEHAIFNVSPAVGNAVKDMAFNRQYDVIVITGSMASVPELYKKALNVGGRMFVVIGEDPVMEACLVTRIDEDAWAEQFLFETSVKPLVSAETEKQFTF